MRYFKASALVALGVILSLAISVGASPIANYYGAGAIWLRLTSGEGITWHAGNASGDAGVVLKDSAGNDVSIGGGGATGDVNLTQVKGSAIDTNTGSASAATLRIVPATGSTVAATQSGTFTVQPGNTANTTPWLVTQTGALPAGSALIGGINLAQVNGSTVDIGNGGPGGGTPRVAVSTGSSIGIAAGVANTGYTICGHTAVKSREVTIANGDGAQTNASIVGTIATGTCVEVYGVAAATNSTTDVGLRVGFGASVVPTAALAGVDGLVFSHPGIAKNSGMVGGIGCSLLQTGASGEEVRMTTTAAPASSTTLAIILGYRTISC